MPNPGVNHPVKDPALASRNPLDGRFPSTRTSTGTRKDAVEGCRRQSAVDRRHSYELVRESYSYVQKLCYEYEYEYSYLLQVASSTAAG
eukprot:scaffold243539_cov14-Prasinocladus_malaysianus.AAC.1